MADEGALAVQLTVDEAQVTGVLVRSTRQTDFSRVLVGLPVQQALTLVPALFSICSAAQAIAGVQACEAALGVDPGPGQRALRRALAALEALDNHCFQFFVEWPRQLGLGPDVGPFKALRAAIAEVRRSLGARPGVAWAVPGGLATAPDPVQGLDALEAAFLGFLPAPARATLDAFEAWAVGQPFLAAARAAGAQRSGRVTAPLLPVQDAVWFLPRLVDASFSARPVLDAARPAESGALTFVQEQALVAEVLAREGRTTWARLVAKFADVARLLRVVREEARQVGAGPGGGASNRLDGAGAGVADTSRGRLAHAVVLQQGRVSAWRTVAPTEWSFHPEGVVREALLGTDAPRAQQVARLLVAALDPCVACTVDVVREGTPRPAPLGT